jgi:hypothetical protein
MRASTSQSTTVRTSPQTIHILFKSMGSKTLVNLIQLIKTVYLTLQNLFTIHRPHQLHHERPAFPSRACQKLHQLIPGQLIPGWQGTVQFKSICQSHVTGLSDKVRFILAGLIGLKLPSAKPHFHAILCHRLGMFWQKYSIYMVLHDYYKSQANFVTNCQNE